MPYKEISDQEFVNEMRILWRGSDDKTRNTLNDIILKHFDCGDRGLKIVAKMKKTFGGVDVMTIG